MLQCYLTVVFFPLKGSGWRPEISESVRQLLIEEVGTSNPPFPAQMFITRFLKRRTDHQQQCTAAGQSDCVTAELGVHDISTCPFSNKFNYFVLFK